MQLLIHLANSFPSESPNLNSNPLSDIALSIFGSLLTQVNNVLYNVGPLGSSLYLGKFKFLLIIFKG